LGLGSIAQAKRLGKGDKMKDIFMKAEEWLSALQSYGRHFLVLAVAQYAYLVQNNEVPTMGNLVLPALIAVIGPALKAVNPNNLEFGFKSKK
jgi:hypothetical protein